MAGSKMSVLTCTVQAPQELCGTPESLADLEQRVSAELHGRYVTCCRASNGSRVLVFVVDAPIKGGALTHAVHSVLDGA